MENSYFYFTKNCDINTVTEFGYSCRKKIEMDALFWFLVTTVLVLFVLGIFASLRSFTLINGEAPLIDKETLNLGRRALVYGASLLVLITFKLALQSI